MTTRKQKIILVTGGSGFLGQHIIKELQEEDDVKEIRVFDCKPYENKLEYAVKHPITSYTGDIQNMEDLKAVMVGVSCVIHTAGVIDIKMFPNRKILEDINVKGTYKVIQACIAMNVPRLIFTSSADVVVGKRNIINGDESLPYPKQHLFEGYAVSKQQAETLVLAANDKPLARGGGHVLRTLSLRPTALYGEGDQNLMTTTLKKAKKFNGTLPRVGSTNAMFQMSYVGNVAWAHVCSMKALENDATVSGRAYFVNDDTPIRTTSDSIAPFLAARNFRMSSYHMPFWLMVLIYSMLEWLIWLLKPIYKMNMKESVSVFYFTNMSIYFKRTLAEEKLKYKPKYTNAVSFENSVKFYKKVNLD